MPLNTRLLSGICATLPAVAMAAAHWFPWRRLFKRDLHRLEAYTIGTTAIVGTAAIAMAASDGDGHDHSRMLLLAAAAAGMTTLVAYTVDEFVRLRGKIAGLEAEQGALQNEQL